MRTLLLHGHIFKNAGSTFDWSLQRSFGADFLEHRQDQQMKERGAAHLLELITEHPQLRALSSHHLCYPLPELHEVHLEPVFLMRHPLARMASAYAFERRQQAQTPGALAAKRFSFHDYIEWRLQPEVSPALRNYQTLYMLGLHDHSQPLLLDHDLFSAAEARLAKLACVGVVERYDESMLCLEHFLGTLIPGLDLAYRKQNATADWVEAGLDSSVESVLEKLQGLKSRSLQENQYDLALYEQANRQLDQALAGIADCDQRLDSFRDRCRALDAG